MNSWIENTNKVIRNIKKLIPNELIDRFSPTNTALEITNKAVRMISLKALANNQYQLQAAIEVPLTEPSFNDDKITNMPYLASVVTKLLSELPKNKQKIMLSLPANRIISHSMTINHKVDRQGLKEEAIRYLDQCFPYQKDQVYYDYQLLDNRDHTQERQLLLVGAHQDVIEQYINLSELASASLEVVDVHSYVLYRLIDQGIWQKVQDTPKPIIFIEANQAYFAVTVLIPEEIPTFSEVAVDQSIDQDNIAYGLGWFKRIWNMVQSSFDFTHQGFSVYLSGDIASLEPFKDELEKITQTPITLFNPFLALEIEIPAQIQITNPFKYLIPVGLALRKEVSRCS